MQWKLIKPSVLKGVVVINIPDHIKLIILSDANPLDHQNILSDIIKSMQLTVTQFLWISYQQMKYLQFEHSVICLQELDSNLENTKFDEKLTIKLIQFSNWLNFKNSSQEKKALWEQYKKTINI